MSHRVVQIRRAAPAKPAPGQPCNGCGVCCLVEPCPLGRLLSGRRSGRCRVLRWDEGGQCYRCGALDDPSQALRRAWPRAWRSLVPVLAPWLGRLAPRWIAVGRGCDCDLELTPVAGPVPTDRQSGA